MRCVFCGSDQTKVVDKRDVQARVRRRRECLKCCKRFTTYEVAEDLTIYVVKKNGEKQPFAKDKLINGLSRACEKRPVEKEAILRIADTIERKLRRMKRLPTTDFIGKKAMAALRKLDTVAYIRFASVYKNFDTVHAFEKEVKELR